MIILYDGYTTEYLRFCVRNDATVSPRGYVVTLSRRKLSELEMIEVNSRTGCEGRIEDCLERVFVLNKHSPSIICCRRSDKYA